MPHPETQRTPQVQTSEGGHILNRRLQVLIASEAVGARPRENKVAQLAKRESSIVGESVTL